jgi:hypothetical protein
LGIRSAAVFISELVASGLAAFASLVGGSITEIELSGLSQRVTALHGAVVTGAAGGAIAEV